MAVEIDTTTIEVCTDCYFAHHYGVTEDDGQWFAGDSDGACDRKPLGLLDDTAWIADSTDSDTGEGFTEFSWSRCEGCGSTLGGARYSLTIEV